jgi:nucleoside-diphosphate-sugar epimerase
MDFLKTDINNIVNGNGIDFSYLKNKKVLITGATGLVGFYLTQCVKHLQNELNIDVCLSYRNSIPDYLKEYYDFPYLEIKEDITDIELKSDYFDVIIHSSGYAQPIKFLNDGLTTIKINTTATINLLNSLKKDGKFLFVSTSEIYNGNDNFNITEEEIGNTTPSHNRACYIESKRCGETICNVFKSNGYNIKIARLSLAYGPFTKLGDLRVLNSIIDKGLNNNNITLLDDGSAIRTYCYITDVVEMFWNILLHGKETVYNVSGFSSSSIKELADKVGKRLDKEVVTSSSSSLAGSPKIVNISSERYIKEFNKNKFVDMETGLDNTIEWMKNINQYKSYDQISK